MADSWLYSGQNLLTPGLNGLLILAVPMLLNESLLRVCQRHLPKNFFIFVLLNGFASAAFATILMMIATSLVLLLQTPYTWAETQYHYLIPAPTRSSPKPSPPAR